MKIHEALDRDPRTARLASGGQARIAGKTDEPAMKELQAEIETFVCDGQFGDALQRILDRYLASLGTPKQESAWVSGFFGSGKSHLLKMLAAEAGNEHAAESIGNRWNDLHYTNAVKQAARARQAVEADRRQGDAR